MNVIERAKAWVSAARASRTEDSGCEIITDLLSIVERLPVTADGVPITVGMVMWPHPAQWDGNEMGATVAYCHGFQVWDNATHADYELSTEELAGAYSTRAAAEAAREWE